MNTINFGSQFSIINQANSTHKAVESALKINKKYPDLKTSFDIIKKNNKIDIVGPEGFPAARLFNDLKAKKLNFVATISESTRAIAKDLQK